MSRYFLVLRGNIKYAPLRHEIICVDQNGECFTIQNVHKGQVKYRGAKLYYDFDSHPKKMCLACGNALYGNGRKYWVRKNI